MTGSQVRVLFAAPAFILYSACFKDRDHRPTGAIVSERKTRLRINPKARFLGNELRDEAYCETVCTTLPIGRALEVGTFSSFSSASSYSGSDWKVVLALICTIL